MIIKKAGCILVNLENKKIALVLRKGDYSFPKGHLEDGETIKECAIRETIEETGHEVEILGDEIDIIKYKSSGNEDVENHFFIGIDMGLTNKFIAKKDREKTDWFRIDEIEDRLSYENLKKFWKSVKENVEKCLI
jgi:bll6630 protein